MMSQSDRFKLSFQLTAQHDGLEVRVRTVAGQCRVETTLPPQDILDRLLRSDPAHIPPPELAIVGHALYQRLTAGEAGGLVAHVFDEARSQQRPVHFELCFDPDQARLAQYPWETISDNLGRFLVRDGLVDLTRYICYPQPPGVFDTAFRTLPILQVVSRPRTLQPLAPASLGVERVERLLNATFEQFQYKLLIERLALWGLHFDGHGGMALQCAACETLHSLTDRTCSVCGASLADGRQVGVLAFEHDGQVEWITTEQLGSVLYNAHVRLALLLACETARVGDHLIFSGLAPGLVLAGVPAVVGMQYPVTDTFAGSFANGFYARLLRSNDLLDAMRAARALHLRESWYSPVLYLRQLRVDQGELARHPVYQTRNIDTAVPAEVQAGVAFLVRLWIRRPSTPPLPPEQLRQELGVLTPVPISTREAEAELKLEPVEGRKLRRGTVDVTCYSPAGEVIPDRISLFVDEHLDAPPAIFTVRADRAVRSAVFFTVWQDGGEIASMAHAVQVVDAKSQPGKAVDAKSLTVAVQGAVTETFLRDVRPASRIEPVCLVVQGGPQAGTRVRLSGRTMSIGRSPSSDLTLQDPKLSRNHAEIRWQGGGWTIADLGSTNGTFVNGVPVAKPRPIGPGDRIAMGGCLFAVERDEARVAVAAASTGMMPSLPADRPARRDVDLRPAKAEAVGAPSKQRGRPAKPVRPPWGVLVSVLLVLGAVGVAMPAALSPRRMSGIRSTATEMAVLIPTQSTLVAMTAVMETVGPQDPEATVTPKAKPTRAPEATNMPPTPTRVDATSVPGPPGQGGGPQAEFLGDVTIPDGTIIQPGTPFVKTWRFRNSGPVSWGEGVRLVFVEGEYRGFESNQMQGPDWVAVPEVLPGRIVDVSVELVAPAWPGTHRSYWRLRLEYGEWLEDLHYAEIVVR